MPGLRIRRCPDQYHDDVCGTQADVAVEKIPENILNEWIYI
jgi:hypothetical protein